MQQPAAEGDPGAIFSTLINSQDKFSEYIRIAYDKKCALRSISLIENHHIGCDAAHIQPASSNGPLLPTNGFLLSADLHRCFDSGLMSLTDWGEVVVSGNVPGNSELHSYEGKIITPTAGWEAYKPYKEYCKHHRKHIFESRLQSNYLTNELTMDELSFDWYQPTDAEFVDELVVTVVDTVPRQHHVDQIA